MTRDERIKLGQPFMLLVGFCQGAEELLKVESLNPWATRLLQMAANAEKAWNETLSTVAVTEKLE